MLKDEIAPYTDGNGLVAPNLVPHGTLRASDNGPMYTSEYVIMLKKNLLLSSGDIGYFQRVIGPCFIRPGLLCRAPGSTDQEGPDDYYGLFAACRALELRGWPNQVLSYAFRNKGCLNNQEIGAFSWESFLFRQPQLLACAFAAANRVSILTFPLFLVAALVILTSCMRTDPGNTDARRLCWLLIQCTQDVSLMCRLASHVWFKRLARDYPAGNDGATMVEVAKIYYNDSHPFQKYWVD